MNGKRIGFTVTLVALLFATGAVAAEDRSQKGAAPKGIPSRQRTPASAAEMNRIPVKVPPQSVKEKLQAAIAAVEASEKNLKSAVNAMVAYCDKEAACAGKSWTAQEMEKGCVPEDSLKICKEKLVAACASSGRGSDKGKLWKNVQRMANDLANKSQAVNGVYGAAEKIPFDVPGIGDGPIVF